MKRGPNAARGARWLLAALPLAGCTDGSGGATPEETVSAVAAFDATDPSTIAGLNEIYRRGGDVVAALAPFFADDDRDRRWAAVYLAALLADTPEEAAILARALSDADPVIRVLAAGSLAGLGQRESLPVLVEGLGVDAPLAPGSEAGRPTSDLALEALTAYTSRDFSAPGEWRAWLGRTMETLRWNGVAYVEG